MKLTIVDRAYLAGIMDGEGSISLVRSHAKRTGGRYLYPLVRIASCDPILIDWIRTKVTNGHRGYLDFHPRHRPVHHVAWASNDAIELLATLLPYLKIKRERAEVVLRLWVRTDQARKAAGGYFGNGHPLPDWLMREREEAFALMAKLNKRGKPVGR